jgi:hypothetical protein
MYPLSGDLSTLLNEKYESLGLGLLGSWRCAIEEKKSLKRREAHVTKGKHRYYAQDMFVRIEPIQAKEKQKTISELSGAWSGDPTIRCIFEKIDQEHQGCGNS